MAGWGGSGCPGAQMPTVALLPVRCFESSHTGGGGGEELCDARVTDTPPSACPQQALPSLSLALPIPLSRSLSPPGLGPQLSMSLSHLPPALPLFTSSRLSPPPLGADLPPPVPPCAQLLHHPPPGARPVLHLRGGAGGMRAFAGRREEGGCGQMTGANAPGRHPVDQSCSWFGFEGG